MIIVEYEVTEKKKKAETGPGCETNREKEEVEEKGRKEVWKHKCWKHTKRQWTLPTNLLLELRLSLELSLGFNLLTA